MCRTVSLVNAELGGVAAEMSGERAASVNNSEHHPFSRGISYYDLFCCFIFLQFIFSSFPLFFFFFFL